MLGKEDRQISFFDTGFVCAHSIDKKSFYAKMHDCADKIITDDDFADIYCFNNGRLSVPPARITKVLILETYEHLSDREALEMVRFNIKWKYALDVPIDYEGFDRSLLVYFRARLLINNKDKLVFKKTLEFAREAGLLKKEVDQVIDSTPMLGAAAVKDTYKLLRDGIRKILSLADKKRISKMSLSLKAYGKNEPKPKINWDNKKEREELLSILVSDVKEVLSHIDTNKEDIDNELKDAANLLAKIVAQDIEKDKKNKPRIKKGVAKDRIISITDPEMRHGRKSSSGKFNGHKTHITKDVSSEIITNIDVSSGNCPDKKMAELIFHGLRKARYIGKRKSRLQALFTAAAVNLKKIFKEQQEKKVTLDIAEAIPALT